MDIARFRFQSRTAGQPELKRTGNRPLWPPLRNTPVRATEAVLATKRVADLTSSLIVPVEPAPRTAMKGALTPIPAKALKAAAKGAWAAEGETAEGAIPGAGDGGNPKPAKLLRYWLLAGQRRTAKG
jgi:hypothetical protein